MNVLRNLTVGALLAAAAVATATAEERIEIITVTANPRTSLPVVEKVAPVPTANVVAPMPTDMPEAEIDYHMQLIGESPAPAAERATS
jgi:hypothetical protein